MASLKRAELIQMICKQAHITRKALKLPEFTKEELLKLHAFLVLTNDVVGARGDSGLQHRHANTDALERT